MGTDAASAARPEGEDQARIERLVGAMLRRDAFSRWLGLEVVWMAAGACTARMTVRAEMVNGFGVAHGGIVFSLADSAMALASNTHGSLTVSIENSVTYPEAVRVGDELTAEAVEESASRRLAFYRVVVRNQAHVVVALFRGTVYRTAKPLDDQA